MKDQFILLPIALQNKQTVAELHKCNDITVRFGLQLSENDIMDLIENRKEALEKSGRVEFGGGVIQKIIMEFVDSPYFYQDNYAETLMELQEIFYYFKNESLEKLTDDDLIKIMRKAFDDICQGSVEYLQSTILENYCRDVRYDSNEYRDMDGYEDDYIDFFDFEGEEW